MGWQEINIKKYVAEVKKILEGIRKIYKDMVKTEGHTNSGLMEIGNQQAGLCKYSEKIKSAQIILDPSL